MIRNKTDAKKAFFIESKGFHPLIIRKDDSFCVYLPEWKISGVGTSLEEAYRQFEQNCKAVEAHAAEFGLSALTPEPYPVLKKGAVLQDLTMFFVKLASSAFIVILVIILLLPNISVAVRHNLKEIITTELRNPRYWALEFPAQVNARLDRLTAEEEEKMRNEWSKLFSRTAPIVSALTCQPQKQSKPVRSD